MGRIVRTISKDAAVVCSAIEATDIVGEIEKIHETSAVVTAALGRLAMGTSLIGFGLKGQGRQRYRAHKRRRTCRNAHGSFRFDG